MLDRGGLIAINADSSGTPIEATPNWFSEKGVLRKPIVDSRDASAVNEYRESRVIGLHTSRASDWNTRGKSVSS